MCVKHTAHGRSHGTLPRPLLSCNGVRDKESGLEHQSSLGATWWVFRQVGAEQAPSKRLQPHRPKLPGLPRLPRHNETGQRPWGTEPGQAGQESSWAGQGGPVSGRGAVSPPVTVPRSHLPRRPLLVHQPACGSHGVTCRPPTHTQPRAQSPEPFSEADRLWEQLKAAHQTEVHWGSSPVSPASQATAQSPAPPESPRGPPLTRPPPSAAVPFPWSHHCWQPRWSCHVLK